MNTSSIVQKLWNTALQPEDPDPGERFDIVLINPPFGKKVGTKVAGVDGKGVA